MKTLLLTVTFIAMLAGLAEAQQVPDPRVADLVQAGKVRVVQLDYTFLVPAGSSIQRIADADRPGVRIAVVRDHASTSTLSRTLKHAQLIYAATPDPTFELLRTGHADVFASVRAVLLAYSTKLPGSRVLEDHYGANLLGMVVPNGQNARLAYISEFIEQAKASGLVQQAIERAGLPGHQVAPAKTN